MTARSEHGKYIRGYAANVLRATGPVDTGAVRDALVNNATHLADEGTEIRCNLTRPAGTFWTLTFPTIAEWYRPFGLYAIEMPLQRLQSGDSVDLVTNLSASVSVGTLTIRVWLGFTTHAFPPPVSDLCAEVSTTSTTAVSLTPDPIFMPSARYPTIPGGREGLLMPSLRGDGSIGVADVPIVYLHLAWKISEAADAALYGLSAREFIG